MERQNNDEKSDVPVRTINVAMAQMLVVGGQIHDNMQRACTMIERAKDSDAQVVVLPECLDVGWTHPSARELAQPIPGDCSDTLCQMAQSCQMYVVAGLTEKCGSRIYNTAVLISPQGTILHKHRKINILDIAQDLYSVGTCLSSTETPIGHIGINICADNFPNSLVFGHSLARMGSQIILSPCSWAVEADHDNRVTPYGQLWEEAYGTLAQLYGITVIGVSNVGWISDGLWKGRKCIGSSLAVGPGGQILARGSYGDMAEELIHVQVPLVERKERGTDIAEALETRGTLGP